MRAKLVWMHRYAGLVMAGFLLITGLTGALLAWYSELDSMINARMMLVKAPPGAMPIDSLVLRDLVQATYADADAHYVALRPLEGKAQMFYLSQRQGRPEPANNEVFVNPYTGTILGARNWGDISQGMVNLMPFIYRLHYSLALGTIGTWIFGIVAAIWTLDCFIGAWLSFPQRRSMRPSQSHSSWLARWRPAWKVRWQAGSHKRNFDLHRAGGLWPWALLVVLAWSSVALNLNQEIYRPVMRHLFIMQPEVTDELPLMNVPMSNPPLGWSASLIAARTQVAAVAKRDGLVIINEDRMSFDPQHGVIRFVVRTERDINEQYAQSSVYINASNGKLIAVRLPTGQAAGDTITSWITTMHMASIWGWPFRIVITVVGMGVALLSVTGLLVWWKKRLARKVALQATAARTTC